MGNHEETIVPFSTLSPKARVQLGENDPRWASNGNGSYNETPNPVPVKGYNLSSSRWATPVTAAPALFGRPASVFLTGAANPTNQAIAPRVVSGDKEDVFANQAMRISLALAAAANNSELCAPRRHLSGDAAPVASQAPVKVTQDAGCGTQNVEKASSASTKLTLTTEQIFAAMANANPRKQGTTLYQARQSYEDFRSNTKSNSRNGSNSSTPPRQAVRTEVKSITTPYSNTSGPKTPSSAGQTPRSVQYTKARSLTPTGPANCNQRSPSVKAASIKSSTGSTRKPVVTRVEILAAMRSADPARAPASISSQLANHIVSKIQTSSISTSKYATHLSQSTGSATATVASQASNDQPKATPSHLRRSLGPSVFSAQSPPSFLSGNINLKSPNTASRFDSTDAVARRMVGKALGINIAKKEDVRSMAIDAALKENVNGGKKTWDDVKKLLEMGESGRSGLEEKIEESKSVLDVDEHKQKGKDNTTEMTQEAVKKLAEHCFREGAKAAVEEIVNLTIQKNLDAFMAAWKAGKVSKAQE